MTLSELSSHCLNPCFNGRYSLSDDEFSDKELKYVLILVLMEDTLRGGGYSPVVYFNES